VTWLEALAKHKRELGLGRFAVATFIGWRGDIYEGDDIWSSIGTFAQKADVGYSTAQRAIRWLLAHGWIERDGTHPITGRLGHTVRYRLIIPEESYQTVTLGDLQPSELPPTYEGAPPTLAVPIHPSSLVVNAEGCKEANPT